MSATSRIGTAVAAGYVLGRFKKMRMALIIGSALANRNVRAAIFPGSSGEDKSSGSSSALLDAGRSAVVAAASTSMNRISDRLHERSVALNGSEDDAEGDEDYDEEPDDEADEADEAEEDEDEDEDEEPADDDEGPGDDEDFEDEPVDEDEDEDEDARSSRRRRTAAPGRS